MNSKLWIRRALSMCLMVAVFATYSMVALAVSDRIAGELTITGNGMNGETPLVTVNGETAKNGRSVFSSSVISTPSNSGATINFGKLGNLELAPNTIFTVSFDSKSISGELTSGKLTVLSSANSINIKTSSDQVVKVSAGESVSANAKAKDDDDDVTKGGGLAWWAWAAIFGGAVAGIVIATLSDNNRVEVGGGSTTVSPSR